MSRSTDSFWRFAKGFAAITLLAGLGCEDVGSSAVADSGQRPALCVPGITLMGDSQTHLDPWAEAIAADYPAGFVKVAADPGISTVEHLPGTAYHDEKAVDTCTVHILLGTNDAGPFHRLEPAEFANNLSAIIEDLALAHHATRIIVSTPPKIFRDRPLDEPSKELLDAYRSRIRALCEGKADRKIVECGEDFWESIVAEDLIDGMHWSESAQREKVYPKMAALLAQTGHGL